MASSSDKVLFLHPPSHRSASGGGGGSLKRMSVSDQRQRQSSSRPSSFSNRPFSALKPLDGSLLGSSGNNNNNNNNTDKRRASGVARGPNAQGGAASSTTLPPSFANIPRGERNANQRKEKDEKTAAAAGGGGSGSRNTAGGGNGLHIGESGGGIRARVGGYRATPDSSLPRTPILGPRGPVRNPHPPHPHHRTNSTTTNTSASSSTSSAISSAFAGGQSAVFGAGGGGKPNMLRPTTVAEDLEDEVAEEKVYTLETADDHTMTLAVNLLRELRRGIAPPLSSSSAGGGGGRPEGRGRGSVGGGVHHHIPLKDAKREETRRWREHQLQVVHRRQRRCEKKFRLVEEMYREAIQRRSRAHAKMAADPPAERWIDGSSVLLHIPARLMPPTSPIRNDKPSASDRKAGGGGAANVHRSFRMPSSRPSSSSTPLWSHEPPHPMLQHPFSSFSSSPTTTTSGSPETSSFSNTCPHLLSLAPFLSDKPPPHIPRLGEKSSSPHQTQMAQAGAQGGAPSTSSFVRVFLTELDEKERKRRDKGTRAEPGVSRPGSSFSSSLSSSSVDSSMDLAGKGKERRRKSSSGRRRERGNSSGRADPDEEKDNEKERRRDATSQGGSGRAPFSAGNHHRSFFPSSSSCRPPPPPSWRRKKSRGEEEKEGKERDDGDTAALAGEEEREGVGHHISSVTAAQSLAVPRHMREAWGSLGYEILYIAHESQQKKKNNKRNNRNPSSSFHERHHRGISLPQHSPRRSKGRRSSPHRRGEGAGAGAGLPEEVEDEKKEEKRPGAPSRTEEEGIQKSTAVPASSAVSSSILPRMSSSSSSTSSRDGVLLPPPPFSSFSSYSPAPSHRLPKAAAACASLPPAFLIHEAEDAEGGLMLPSYLKKQDFFAPISATAVPLPTSGSSSSTSASPSATATTTATSHPNYPHPHDYRRLNSTSSPHTHGAEEISLPLSSPAAAAAASTVPRLLPPFRTYTNYQRSTHRHSSGGGVGGSVGGGGFGTDSFSELHWLKLAPLAPVYLVQRRLDVEGKKNWSALVDNSRKYRTRRPVVSTQRQNINSNAIRNGGERGGGRMNSSKRRKGGKEEEEDEYGKEEKEGETPPLESLQREEKNLLFAVHKEGREREGGVLPPPPPPSGDHPTSGQEIEAQMNLIARTKHLKLTL